MKYLAIVLAVFVCGAFAQGEFEDLLTPEEAVDANMVKNFSHYLLENSELDEDYQTSLEEMVNIIGVGESDDLEFEDEEGRGNKTRKFKCKANKCALCFSKRRWRRRIRVCVFVAKVANNLVLKVARGKRVVLSGSTPVKSPKPICKSTKCPMFGPFCGIFSKVKVGKKGAVTGCLIGQATMFKKKVMKRQIGCFSLTAPKTVIDPGFGNPAMTNEIVDSIDPAEIAQMKKIFRNPFGRWHGKDDVY